MSDPMRLVRGHRGNGAGREGIAVRPLEPPYCHECFRPLKTTEGYHIYCDRCVQKSGRIDRDAKLVSAVKKMHQAEWARIRPCCEWSADSVDADTNAARIVLQTVIAKASGVLS